MPTGPSNSDRLTRLEAQFDRLEIKLARRLELSIPDRPESRVSHLSLQRQLTRVQEQLVSQAVLLQGYHELVAMLGGVLEAMRVIAAEINAARGGGVQA